MKKKIAVVFGGRSPEHEVSIESAKTVCSKLEVAGFAVLPFYAPRRGAWRLVRPKALLEGRPLTGPELEPSLAGGCFKKSGGGKVRPDVVFPMIHGSTGEDGVLQGLLEMLGLPYTGCGVTSSAVSMDKLISKELASREGAPVLPQVVIRAHQRPVMGPLLGKAARLGFPLFVKPVAQGSSVGVTKVKKRGGLRSAVENAFRFDTAVMIEKGVDRAREIVCGVLGAASGAAASVTGEVVPKGGHEFYDYEAKYLDNNGMELRLPAPLPAATSAALRAMAVKVFHALGASGLARLDFFVDPGNPRRFWFCEINTLPGFTSHSLYPRLWEKTGLKPEAVLKELVRIALKERAARNRLSTARN
ncbi:MAG: D-alanine--D-alanine ligase A [Elusimicrobia bacterium CG08_land_8_20_14_0_20_59_10]|nr:MAG: D-alanine--D-alanine ligase A [Elusimicrobia bacterium CG08_land_8_20_14_0_20_59_10]